VAKQTLLILPVRRLSTCLSLHDLRSFTDLVTVQSAGLLRARMLTASAGDVCFRQRFLIRLTFAGLIWDCDPPDWTWPLSGIR
jgi:hypothetical protein